MRVLFLAAEAAPLVKVGGLGDVAGELPHALRRLGVDARLAIPRYPHLTDLHADQAPRARLEVPGPVGASSASLYEMAARTVPVWLIDGPPIGRVASVYGAEAEDAVKFVFFVIAALQACRALGWKPDVVHAHDWHTAPALAWMRTVGKGWDSTAAVLTIHNLAYMGAGGGDALRAFGIPPAGSDLVPEWARRLPLPLGLLHADAITTVSPGYAAEIQTASLGYGLEGLLSARSGVLRGILNGIDPEVWDPAREACLASPYDWRTIARRAPNKADLQKAVGLPVQERTPLLAMIGRLERQKGVDLLLGALPQLADHLWQLVLLGTGDPVLEEQVQAFAASHADRVRFLPTFDVELSRRIYAGADMIVVPSRYEPCGLVQLISLRYGAVPIVHSTGGLKDTVQPFSARGGGTGFLFEPDEPEALAAAIQAAFRVYDDPRAWHALQRRGMTQDFSWTRSARAYAGLYREVVALRGPRPGGDE